MVMTMSKPFIVFLLDEQRFALPCSDVKRIVRIVEITPVPDLPKGMLGVINMQGKLIPVLDLRHRLGLKPVESQLEDLLVIVEKQKQIMTFIVNQVNFYEFLDSSSVTGSDVIEGLECVEKIIKDKSGIIHVLNINKL
jgi:purine-binding chemotaxis protein CheW